MGKATSFIVLLVSIISVFTSYSFANTTASSVVQATADAQKEIELHGSVVKGNTRSFYTPLQAIQGPQFIRVNVLSPMGALTIEVVNDGEKMVYQTIFDTSIQSEFLIDISDWNAGDYSIVFMSDQGRCMYGDFEISQ